MARINPEMIESWDDKDYLRGVIGWYNQIVGWISGDSKGLYSITTDSDWIYFKAHGVIVSQMPLIKKGGN